jgi:YaiO family outer membrane protein
MPHRRVAELLAAGALALLPLAGATAQAALPLSVEVGHSREVLTGGRADWTESYVRLTQPLGGRDHLWGQLRRTVRFEVEDVEVSSGVAVGLGAGVTGTLDASYSPTSRVLPAWSTGAGLHQALGGGWGVGVGVRHTVYSDVSVDVVSGTVERYYGPFRSAYTLALATVERESSGLTHALAQSYYYGHGSAITVGGWAGRQAVVVGVDDIRLASTHALAAWGVHWLPTGVGLSWGVGWARDAELYERTRFQLGVRSRL